MTKYLLLPVCLFLLAAQTEAAPHRKRGPKKPPASQAYKSPLERPAYGSTKAFVDTDGDGQKFDFEQPPRERHSHKGARRKK